MERDTKGRFLRGNQVARKHGCLQYWTDGKLPPGRKSQRLRAELKRIRLELEQTLSGNGKGISVQEDLLIQQVIKTNGFCVLFENYLRQYGVLDKGELKRNKVQFQAGF